MSVAREASESSNNPQSPPLVSAGGSDRCPVCGAHLAVDQRYCVECGTRRGAPRFSLTSSAAGPTAAGASSASPPRTSGFQRFMRPSSSASLLLGLLILLVALGIGVLIGHNGSPKQTKQPVSVVANFGSGSGSSSSGSTAATGNSAGSNSTRSSVKATKSSTKKSAAKKAASTPKAAAKIKKKAAATAKSFSTTATKKSTVGGSCQAGTAGCVNGKQTGNLF